MPEVSRGGGCRRGCGYGCGCTGLVLICAIMLLLYFPRDLEEKRIVRLVSTNLESLNECITNQTYDKACELKGVETVRTWPRADGELYIEFFCSGFGLPPSSVYEGFYYVSDDKPLGFQASPVPWQPDGDGWRWREDHGDNWQYTKKITDHWYYYKAGF